MNINKQLLILYQTFRLLFLNISSIMPEQCIKVYARVRPHNPKQQQKNLSDFLYINPTQKQITIRDINRQRNMNKTFTFDQIFDPNSTQSNIFDITSTSLTKDVILGYNGTIFAYGQTGSGKTYTMMGDVKEEKEMGIIPRCFASILQAARADKSKDYLIMCSYIELYNQQLRDLLHFNEKFKLELRESPEKGIFISGLKKVSITSLQEMMKYLKIGNQNRTTGQTLMNTQSSRSHSIFTIYVESLQKINENAQKLVGSKFNLVDLAGSERQSKTKNTGDRFLEATKINLSLTALGKVIATLVEGNNSHIPYRDSKLTRILQDSLGGNSKTVMIATLSPSSYNFEQTLSTLKYASRAKYITNSPIINLDPKDALLKQYEIEIKKLRSMLGDIQKEDQPVLDQLIQENKRIMKKAQQEKKELILKIKKLEQQFISTPYGHNSESKKQRSLRQQKLNFMESNYRNLEQEVKQMRNHLEELRTKYKRASKQIFQMQNDHEKQKQLLQQQYEQLEKQNIVLKSVLNVLFTDKQLKNIIGLGSWTENKFKLPQFYFKDRHTLAFPCEEIENASPPETPSIDSRDKSTEKNPVNTTSTSFGLRINSSNTIKRNFINRKK